MKTRETSSGLLVPVDEATDKQLQDSLLRNEIPKMCPWCGSSEIKTIGSSDPTYRMVGCMTQCWSVDSGKSYSFFRSDLCKKKESACTTT